MGISASAMVKSMPDLTGKLVVCTGASGGIGLEFCAAVAAKGARVVMAVRDVEKGAKAKEEVLEKARHYAGPGKELPSVYVVQLDVSSLASVRGFRARLEQVVGADAVLDALVLNAGIMAPPKRQVSVDGFELQMATNCYGHFLLTSELFDMIRRSKDGRIVSVASDAHWSAPNGFIDDVDSEKNYQPFPSYAISKLGNLLFTLKLQRMLTEAGITNVRAFAVHPGITATKLFDKNHLSFLALVGQSPPLGATPTVLAVADARAPRGGTYAGPWFLDFVGKGTWGHSMSKKAKSNEFQDKFWGKCEEKTGVKFQLVGAPAIRIGEEAQ